MIISAILSSIISPRTATVLLLEGSIKSSANTRPKTRSANGSMISSPSLRSEISIPKIVPQSISVTITSCATSTKRRVRYPASAVFRAVSANPFLAPCVEIKYSITDNPSIKFAVIGFSIISPVWPDSVFCGFAINPRIPANCRICSLLPRAPESDIIYKGLKPCLFSCNFLNIVSATAAVTLVQISIILL